MLDGWWGRIWPFPRGKGIFCRALDVLCAVALLRPGWRECNGMSVWVDPRNYLSRCLIHEGVYQPEVSAAVVKWLPQGGVMVDVGANVGYMTMLGARRVGPAGRVLAIEPNPYMVEAMRRHLDKNGISNVSIVQAGCSRAKGSFPLYLSPDRNPGMTSLSAKNAHSQRSIQVDVVPLDELVAEFNPPSLDVLKIDVEGAELQVLQGAKETLRRFRPVILMELDPRLLSSFGTKPEQILELLAGLGYSHGALSEHDIIARC
jgi:FkbM family methyltransferase